MTNLYLKYGNYDGTNTLVYASSQPFTALKVYQKYKRETVGRITMRGTKYQHKKNYRNVYEITLSANDFYGTARFAYLVSCFQADKMQLSWDDVTYIDVIWEGDSLEPEWIEGSKLLPEVTFELEED